METTYQYHNTKIVLKPSNVTVQGQPNPRKSTKNYIRNMLPSIYAINLFFLLGWLVGLGVSRSSVPWLYSILEYVFGSKHNLEVAKRPSHAGVEETLRSITLERERI